MIGISEAAILTSRKITLRRHEIGVELHHSIGGGPAATSQCVIEEKENEGLLESLLCYTQKTSLFTAVQSLSTTYTRPSIACFSIA